MYACIVHKFVLVIVSIFVGHDTTLRAKKSACKGRESARYGRERAY